MAMADAWTMERDGEIASLTMNKPPLNLVYTDDIIELGERLGELRADPDIRAIILTGTGKSFIGGADISQFKAYDTPTAMFGMQLGQRILRDMEEMEKPVIAAINGYAFGGGSEVALACDIRICN